MGHFPFNTRYIPADEKAYCGFTPLSGGDDFDELTFRYVGRDMNSMLAAIQRVRR